MSPSDKAIRTLQKMQAAFPFCPLCDAKDSFKAVGLAKQQVMCTDCKAEWGSPQFTSEEKLIGLYLIKFGKNRYLKPLLSQSSHKIKSIVWWYNARSDPHAGEIDKIVGKMLIEAYGKRESDPAAHQIAMKELDELSPLGQAEIEGLAEGIHIGHSYFARWYLACRGDERWIERALNGMDHEDEKVRRSSIFMAIDIYEVTGNNKIIPKIIELLAHDKSALVRAAAATSLRLAKPDPLVINALKSALNDNSRPPKETELVTAGSFASLAITSVKAFTTNASVGEMALRSLAQIDDPRAADIVIQHVLESRQDLRFAIRVAEAAGSRALKPLFVAMGSWRPSIRERAATIISSVKDLHAIEPLINLLLDTDPVVRRNAAHLLGQIGDLRSVEPLQKLSQEDDDLNTRDLAAQALAMIQKKHQVVL